MALDFATKELAPRTPEKKSFQMELEKTMALLCFPLSQANNSIPPQLQELLNLELRSKVADQINKAIIERSGANADTRLESLLKLWKWGGSKLSDPNYSDFELKL